MSSRTTADEDLSARQQAAFGHTCHEVSGYYAYPLLNQRLDLLQHLTQFSDRILVIRGESGSGKTTLLEHLLQRLGDEVRLCRLSADQHLSSARLLSSLGTALDLRASPSIEIIKQRLGDMQHSSGVCHILIDDAHQLPAATLTTLMSLFYSKGGSALHIALFAEPGIVALLNGTGIASHLGERLQTMGMPALEQEDCAGYLRQRLQATGLQEALPFTEQQIQAIHSRSDGLPGRINAEAIRQLSRPHNKPLPVSVQPAPAAPRPSQPVNTQASTTQPAKKPVGTGLPRKLKWMLSGAFAILVATLLIMQEKINQAFESPTGIQPTTVAPVQTPAPMGLNLPRPNDREALTRRPEQTPTATVDQLAGLHAETQTEIPAEPPRKAAIPLAAMTATIATTTAIAEPAALPQTETQANSPTPASGSSHQEPVKPVSASVLKDADWLLAQPPQSYTMQLLGSINKGVILEFAHRHAITAQSAYYRSLRRGRPWYSLLYGIYPGKKAALAARAGLPPVLQKQSPWIRRLASVQASIRKTDRHPDK